MTNSDRMAALSLTSDQPNRTKSATNPKGKNAGGLCFNKTTGNPFGSDAALLLQAYNGLLVWDRDDPTNGKDAFDNIYQFCAAEIHAPGGTMRNRITVSSQYEYAARAGFNSLGNWMVTTWGAPLFRLKSIDSGNKITVITIHPDYIDPATGKNAATLLRDKDAKQIEGQILAARKRLGRQFGNEFASNVLRNAVETSLAAEIEAPRHQRTELEEWQK